MENRKEKEKERRGRRCDGSGLPYRENATIREGYDGLGMDLVWGGGVGEDVGAKERDAGGERPTTTNDAHTDTSSCVALRRKQEAKNEKVTNTTEKRKKKKINKRPFFFSG